ncbi:hypothetical protein ColTof4_00304 [Colletotrichum tofieldiae]|nr:hypothetical protein ColTof4_00304 [Colletotrichum tofieldiae]GKT91150.1 hypothetical protein Ct61P_09000 [Colletotrichum tofieldiae]
MNDTCSLMTKYGWKLDEREATLLCDNHFIRSNLVKDNWEQLEIGLDVLHHKCFSFDVFYVGKACGPYLLNPSGIVFDVLNMFHLLTRWLATL